MKVQLICSVRFSLGFFTELVDVSVSQLYDCNIILIILCIYTGIQEGDAGTEKEATKLTDADAVTQDMADLQVNGNHEVSHQLIDLLIDYQ